MAPMYIITVRHHDKTLSVYQSQMVPALNDCLKIEGHRYQVCGRDIDVNAPLSITIRVSFIE